MYVVVLLVLQSVISKETRTSKDGNVKREGDKEAQSTRREGNVVHL